MPGTLSHGKGGELLHYAQDPQIIVVPSLLANLALYSLSLTLDSLSFSLSCFLSVDRSEKSTAAVEIYIRTLALLAAVAQPKYEYGVAGIDANDALYGSAPRYLEEVTNLSEHMIEQILGLLKELQPGVRKVALLATFLNT